MYRVAQIVLLCCLPAIVFAADVVRYGGSTDASLQERVNWVSKSANRNKAIWIGYSVSRWMGRNETFLSGVSFSGSFKNSNKPTLQEWIYGVREPEVTNIKEVAKAELNRNEKQSQVKVWKEVGIFQRFEAGAKIPSRTQVMNLTISATFDAPLYWLGQAKHEESFLYMSSLYSETRNANQKEDLMCAIGIHPPAQAFPFLKRILTTDEPEEPQEAAAIFIGELNAPESLGLLQRVAETSVHENVREAAIVGISEMESDEALATLYEIARSHQDRDLRETAIAMLADKEKEKAVRFLEQIAWFDPDDDIRETAVAMLAESDAGVPALLKIMEEHPSAETREIAIYMLAETVAGRKVLKDKIKE